MAATAEGPNTQKCLDKGYLLAMRNLLKKGNAVSALLQTVPFPARFLLQLRKTNLLGLNL